MYGYHFGNRVLQLFSRKTYEAIGNMGTCYRMDGTKFAIIGNRLSWDEAQANYNYMRWSGALGQDDEEDG